MKKEVDEIVKTLAADADIQTLYAEWCSIQRKIVGIYQDKEVEFPPLWENKEFKKIRNAVISEAVQFGDDRLFFYSENELSEQNQHQRQNAAMSALNLFCRLASIIDNDANQKINGHNKTIVDSKERIELMKKKQRLGIKMG